MQQKPMIILTGPTAVGKSDLSVKLARRIGGEIISADSMQVYKGMDIGTAKIRPEEMGGVPHYLIDILMPDDPFHVVIFQQKAKEAVDDICARGHIPIVAGGTGFYIQALLKDVDFTENDGDPGLRRRLEAMARQGEGQKLLDMLAREDPESAALIHPGNLKKVIRALEFKQQTGQKISEHNRLQASRIPPYRFAYFVLTMPREDLYARIDQRVDRMLQEGLIEEVKKLSERGYDRSLVSMQGIGYKEVLAYLGGECSLQEAVQTIKTGTRHFAKRQLTWFRREKDVIWLDKSLYQSDEDLLDTMLSILKEKEILSEQERNEYAGLY